MSALAVENLKKAAVILTFLSLRMIELAWIVARSSAVLHFVYLRRRTKKKRAEARFLATAG
jgi:hypothetical protein